MGRRMKRVPGWKWNLGRAAGLSVLAFAATAGAETRIRIMPPDGGVLALGQRFDVRVEATADSAQPPRELTVLINRKDVTKLNILAEGTGGRTWRRRHRHARHRHTTRRPRAQQQHELSPP